MIQNMKVKKVNSKSCHHKENFLFFLSVAIQNDGCLKRESEMSTKVFVSELEKYPLFNLKESTPNQKKKGRNNNREDRNWREYK